MGARAARRYVLTAERFSAATAERFSLVTEVTEQSLDEAVQPLLQTLIENGPGAVAAAKRLVLDVMGNTIDAELVKETVERIADIRVSPEGQEGLSAFLGKRPPNWQ